MHRIYLRELNNHQMTVGDVQGLIVPCRVYNECSQRG